MRDQAGQDGSLEAVGSECSDAWVSMGSEEEEKNRLEKGSRELGDGQSLGSREESGQGAGMVDTRGLGSR